MILERARCVQFCHICLGGSSTLNLIETYDVKWVGGYVYSRDCTGVWTLLFWLATLCSILHLRILHVPSMLPLLAGRINITKHRHCTSRLPYVPLHQTISLVCRISCVLRGLMRLDVLEQPQTYMTKFYTPHSLYYHML